MKTQVTASETKIFTTPYSMSLDSFLMGQNSNKLYLELKEREKYFYFQVNFEYISNQQITSSSSIV